MWDGEDQVECEAEQNMQDNREQCVGCLDYADPEGFRNLCAGCCEKAADFDMTKLERDKLLDTVKEAELLLKNMLDDKDIMNRARAAGLMFGMLTSAIAYCQGEVKNESNQ